MAGAKVRGITIELSADASGVVSGLKQVNSAVRTTQQQLKDVNRLLKLDPKNITLSKQRTQLLQQQIGNTKQKLTELKKAEEDMRARGVDENSEQFQALQREIIATEQQLEKLNSTAGSGSAKMLQISNATKEFGDKAESAGKKLLPVTAGITALGAASVAAFKEVDAGGDIVIKKTGATGKAAEELKGIMNDIATTIPTDFETAGEAVGEVSTRFGITGTELEKLSKKFVQFAQLNDTNVSDSVDKVQKALSAYGLTSEDAGDYLDRLNKTAQDTGVSADKLADGIVTNSAAFQEIGLSIDQATVFMGDLEKSGANSETVLNGMRKALKNATKEGKPLNQALEELQDTIVNGKDGVDGLTAAYDLFGKSGDQIYSAVKNGTVDFKKLGDAVVDASGNIESTFEATLDPIDKFKVAMNQVKVAGADIGATILQMLAPAIQKLSDFTKNLTTKWQSLDDGQKEMIITIGAVVAAIGPVLIILGKLSSAISSITGLLSKMKITSFLTNPVTLAVGAVAALAAGLAVLITNIEDSNNSLIGYRDELKELKTKNDDLAASIEATNKQLAHNVEQAQVEAETAGKLADQLDILTSKENKTAADKEQILKLVEQLNELVPDLQLAYDKEADSLNRTNKQIRANIELRKQQATVDAYSKTYTEALEEQAQAQINLAEAQDLFDEMLNGTTDDVRAHWEEWDKFGELGVPWDGLEMAKYRGEMVELEKAQKAVSKAQTNVTNATKQSERVYGLLTEQTEVLANEQQKMSKTLNATDLAAFREEVQNTLGDQFTTQLNDAINNAAKAGVEIPEDLKQGILSGKVPVNEAVKQINTMVKNTLAENKKNAATAGTQTGTSFSSSLSAQKSKSKEAALDNANAANAGLNEGKAPASKTGSATGSEYSSGILSKKDLASGNAAAVRNAALNGLKGDSYSRGVELVDGYARGIIDNAARAATAAVNMVWSAIAGIRNAQKSGSPSRVAMTIGEELGEGYSIGILDTIRDAMKAGADLAKGAIEGISDYSALTPTVTLQGATMGNYGTFTGATAGGGSVSNSENIVNNNFTQNNYSPKALTTSEIYRQTNNLIALNGVLL